MCNTWCVQCVSLITKRDAIMKHVKCASLEVEMCRRDILQSDANETSKFHFRARARRSKRAGYIFCFSEKSGHGGFFPRAFVTGGGDVALTRIQVELEATQLERHRCCACNDTFNVIRDRLRDAIVVSSKWDTESQMILQR